MRRDSDRDFYVYPLGAFGIIGTFGIINRFKVPEVPKMPERDREIQYRWWMIGSREDVSLSEAISREV